MSRLGLRQIRKPNVKGAAFAVDPLTTLTPAEETKQVTNGVQTGNKEVTKQITNGVQTGNKQVTSPASEQSPNSAQNDKRVTQRVTSTRVNGVQTDNKQVTKQGWETLRGHEESLLKLIFDECRTSGDLLSPPITLDRIATHLQSRKGTAKTIIFRLAKKGFIRREASATGRGGFTRFRLPKDLYQAILIRETEYKRATNGVQTDNKEVTQRVTQRVTQPSSSSSFLDLEILKTTTTGEPELLKSDTTLLSPEWQAVDYSPLSSFGFTQNHLVQIIRQGKLTATEVQDCIQFFAFDLRRNGKGKEINGSPLNFFMGILRKGIPYAPPENYESPADEARRKTLEFKERKTRERQAEEDRLMELEFSEWKASLSEEQVLAMVSAYAKRPGPVRETELKSRFESEVWPTRKTSLFGDSVAQANGLDPSDAFQKSAAEIGKLIDESLAEAQG